MSMQILPTRYATKEEAAQVAALRFAPGAARVLHRIPPRGAAGPWVVQVDWSKTERPRNIFKACPRCGDVHPTPLGQSGCGVRS